MADDPDKRSANSRMGSEGLRIEDLVVDNESISIDWGDPTPVEPGTFEKMREEIESGSMAHEIAKMSPEDLASIAKKNKKMLDFNLRVCEAVSTLPAKLRQHYQRELLTIIKDAARDIKVRYEDLDEMERAQIAMVLLISEDDDDGDQKTPERAPDDGARKPVPA